MALHTNTFQNYGAGTAEVRGRSPACTVTPRSVCEICYKRLSLPIIYTVNPINLFHVLLNKLLLLIYFLFSLLMFHCFILILTTCYFYLVKHLF